MISGGFPIPVKIKSGQTLNPDYFKGFTYFDTFFPASSQRWKGMLVYGGRRNETRKGIRIASIESLPQTIDQLLR